MRRIVSIIVVVALALASAMSMAGVATAAAGSIAGYVYEEDGSTPISGAVVYAYDWSVDIALGPTTAAGLGYSATNGSYYILGLDTGNYRVVAHADGYYSEYYNNAAAPAAASQVAVTDPNQTAGINFTLAEGGSISGFVYQEDGSTPISPARVIAYDSATGQMVDDDWTEADGSYTVGNNIASADYRVKAEADGYFSEYYDDVPDSASATLVTVTGTGNTPDIDFTLAAGGSITGFVYQDDGVTPIYLARVIAYDSTDKIVDDGWSRADGSYTVGNNIYTGEFRVRADMDGYFSEYYNNAATPGAATLVAVTIPNVTANINFTLTGGGSISGFVYKDDGTTPIYLSRVIAYAYDNVTSQWVIVDDAWSRADGRYTIGNNLYSGDYRVKAEAFGYYSEYYDNVTDSASATPVSVTAPNVTPDINFTLSLQTLIISDVVATVTSETTATITWTTDEPGTSLVEYGLTDAYGSATTENATLVTSHAVYLTGLTRGTTYHYRVVSADASENEGRSGDYTFITPDLTPPVISDVTAVDITATGATITWTTDEPATSQVEYGLTAPGYSTSTTEDPTLVTSHSVVLTGLTSGTTYHYKVKSRDTSGASLWTSSDDYAFNTLDITAPVISSVTASGMTQTGATITWTTSEGATSQVEYGLTTAYGSATTIDTNLLTSHSVSLTGLTAGTTYHYRVKSRDVSNNEAISADFTFTTATVPAPDTTPPSTPVVTDDGASTTDLTQLHATWTSSDAESGIVEYQYAIGTSAGGNDVVDWTSVGTDTGVTKTGLNLSIGTTYYFSVKAQNSQELWSDIGTSNGISVQEETAPEQPSDGGGFPVWAWVIIGIAGGAAVGGLAYWLVRSLPKQPEQK